MKLLIQLARFKEAVYIPMNNILLPLTSKVFGTLEIKKKGLTVNSDEEREFRELHRTYFLFIHALTQCNLDSVFISAENISHITSILKATTQGALENDIATQKTSILILRRFIQLQWTSNQPFKQFILSEVGAVFIKPVLIHKKDMKDYNVDLLVVDILRLQKELLAKYGIEFIEYLGNVLVLEKLTLELTQQYLHLLQNDPFQKQLKLFYRKIITDDLNS